MKLKLSWKLILTILGLIIFFVTLENMLLPGEEEAIELVNSLFLKKSMDYELSIETEAKPYFDKFSSNFDKSKIILVVSLSKRGRYDFIIDPENQGAFVITLTVSVFNKPRFWVHNYSEGYKKIYRRKLSNQL